MIAGLLVVGNRALTIDDDGVITTGTLNAPSLLAGEVMDHVVGADRQALRVVDNHIGWAIGVEDASILESPPAEPVGRTTRTRDRLHR